MPTSSEKKWITAWKLAGPKLEQIRDEELRQKDKKGFRMAAGVTVYETNPHKHGLVKMQAWFMRFQLLKHSTQKASDPSSKPLNVD